MNDKTIKTLLTVLASISLLSGGLLVFLYLKATAVTPESLRNDGVFVYDAPITLDEFNLGDQHGEPFTPDRLQGKWTLAFFGYTFCPDICPLTMASARQFYDLLEASGESADVQVVMVSVDPERDTPEVLGNYVSYFHPDFVGASADYSEVYTLARSMNVTFSYTRVDDENYLVTHNGEILLLDPTGKNIGFFKAPHVPPEMLDNFLAVKAYREKQIQ